jgi:hypothetical protein
MSFEEEKNIVTYGSAVEKAKFAGTDIKARLSAPTEFMPFYTGATYIPCFRRAVNKKYIADGTPVAREEVYDLNRDYNRDATTIFQRFPEWCRETLESCQAKAEIEKKQGNGSGISGADKIIQSGINESTSIKTPFDRRLDRLFLETNMEPKIKTPYGGAYTTSSTVGLLASSKLVNESDIKNKQTILDNLKKEKDRLQKDTMYLGVPAIMNTYALTKLYGSEGGQKLINTRGDRRWYEVDLAFGTGSTTSTLNFASNPTTSSLISWGNADPYGRTPYHFTDFAFCKYWNKIENNRLITLRRFAAPILDNMKFPGMDGVTMADRGSGSRVIFPPMASAVTYFGSETGNDLNKLLAFTSGMKWDSVKSDVWNVGTQSTPEGGTGEGDGAGPSKLFGGLAGLSKMLNVAGGNFSPELIMNEGNLPPDPYKDGPYENRILGPVNRIDEVKKRAPGLDFQWSGLNLIFEYVSRPIGGINTKAVLLDIMSNFLIIGSASAVFFGGQHRFMGNPAKYPFLGGEAGIEAWYSGKPLEWAGQTVNALVGNVTNPESGIMGQAKGFFDAIFGGGEGQGGIKGIFGAVKGLFTEGGIGSNLVKHELAAKTAGQVPYLTGLKALLTGEPVGEWHVTIGNPLNPIAMIGNLICTGIEVEFGDELGPDDFPTEIKITVKMDHAMARDRDAIQSIFNRGMGRIYDLPDSMEGSADDQTKVDKYTQTANETGTAALSKGWYAGPSTTGSVSGFPIIKRPSNEGNTSVWAQASFAAVSPNEDLSNKAGDMARSAYRSVDWVALKSLK